jgi:hypothetical protein
MHDIGYASGLRAVRDWRDSERLTPADKAILAALATSPSQRVTIHPVLAPQRRKSPQFGRSSEWKHAPETAALAPIAPRQASHLSWPLAVSRRAQGLATGLSAHTQLGLVGVVGFQ